MSFERHIEALQWVETSLTPQLLTTANKLEARLSRRMLGRAIGVLFCAGLTMAQLHTPDDRAVALEAESCQPADCDTTATPGVSTTTTIAGAEAAPTTTIPKATTTTQTAAEEKYEAAATEPSLIPTPRIIGADISYPNCNTPIRPDVTFGIVGVNGGRPFTPNPCLADEVTKFKEKPALYVNTSYPGVKLAMERNNPAIACPVAEDLCVAYRWGYSAGQYAVDHAWSQGVSSREWWLDVEVANAWRGNIHEHRVSLLGMMDAIRIFAGKNESINPGEIFEGFYSNNRMWDRITYEPATGHWRPGFQSWYATGVPEESVLNFCRPEYDFAGAGVVMVQTVDEHNLGGALDIDVRCP